jgi:hypothetical protein
MDPDVQTSYGLSAGNSSSNTDAFAVLTHVPVGSLDVVTTPRVLGEPASRESVQVRAGWTTTVMATA